jgi:hypothetical protein
MDWLKAIYGVIGAEHPTLSLVGAATIGALIVGGAWWLVGREYTRETRASNHSVADVPSFGSITTPPSGVPSSSATGAPPPLPGSDSADAAAEHYRRTAPSLKRDEIREAYKAYCDVIANKFALKGWAPINQLTRMVDTNMGDGDAYARAEKEFPSAAWAAIRILVAFETPRERPMYTSYVFIGRISTGEEVIALFDRKKEWKVLSESTGAATDHERLMRDTITSQLRELSATIAPDIRRLK